MANFQDILEEYHIDCDVSGKGANTEGWINFRCPFCQRDPYMGYNILFRYCSCWKCGYQPLWLVLQHITNLGVKECFSLIAEIPQEVTEKSLRSKGTLRLPSGLGDLQPAHNSYLYNRGFNPNGINRLWRVQGIGQLGKQYRWRIWIPVHFHGEVYSWTTRNVIDKEPRYLSAPDSASVLPIRDLLYGIDHVRNAAIVVEGPTDVWRIGPGSVAIMGLRTSPAQFTQLTQIPHRIICFDKEPEAQDRAQQLANNLRPFPGMTTILQLETGKDAASAFPWEIAEIRKTFLGVPE